MVRFVPARLIIREETFYRLVKRDVVRGKFIVLKVVLKIGRCEMMPVDHCLLYSLCALEQDAATNAWTVGYSHDWQSQSTAARAACRFDSGVVTSVTQPVPMMSRRPPVCAMASAISRRTSSGAPRSIVASRLTPPHTAPFT